MKKNILIIGFITLYFGIQSQTVKEKPVKTKEIIKTEKQPTLTAYSYEKRVNGVTVQYFTKEQFDLLPKARKEYYMKHKELFQIIQSTSNKKSK